MSTLSYILANSERPWAIRLRRVRRFLLSLSVPTPAIVVKPLLWVFLVVRAVWWFFKRVLICEPLFKAYCKRYGRNVHTDIFIHHVRGSGSIIVGDDVTIDGKCSFNFAARFSPYPMLKIGSGTIIGHGCYFAVGRRITIGEGCMLAAAVCVMDSPGHPLDAEMRRQGLPPEQSEVRPVTIGNNVWIGRNVTICPGVHVGDNSIIVTGSMVQHNVPANAVVAGYPARVVRWLREGVAGRVAGSRPMVVRRA